MKPTPNRAAVSRLADDVATMTASQIELTARVARLETRDGTR